MRRNGAGGENEREGEEGAAERNEIDVLSGAALERLKWIGELIGIADRGEYGRRREAVAKALKLSERSVDRLVRQGRREGVASIVRRGRSDRGRHRVSREWQEFVVKTYREGNRGSRRMSRAQVDVRVKVRAQEMGSEDAPSRVTVYRIMERLIEQGEAQKRKRSIGWKGERLSLKTRDGKEIGIEWSNQVWQVDHTQVDVFGCRSNWSDFRPPLADGGGGYVLAVYHGLAYRDGRGECVGGGAGVTPCDFAKGV